MNITMRVKQRTVKQLFPFNLPTVTSHEGISCFKKGQESNQLNICHHFLFNV